MTENEIREYIAELRHNANMLIKSGYATTGISTHFNKSADLIEELLAYRAIGTVEQCRGAVEKMKPKKAVEYEDKFYGCPNCSNPLMHKWEKYPTILADKSQGLPYCLNCGQAIDWSDTPETEIT